MRKMSNFNVSSLLSRFGHQRDPLADSLAEPEKKILFVCTGNIARSASAQYIATQLAGETTWTFDSAGIGAVVGAPVAEHIDAELDRRGVNHTGHRAKQLTEDMVASSALVLCMEKEHLDWIVREWPKYRSRVHLLKQMARLRENAGRRADPVSFMMQQDVAPQRGDAIADPYRRGEDAAATAVSQVESSLEVIVPWLGK